MDYSIPATARTPALIIYLIDISGSMADPFESGKKIDYVNRAIAGALQRMIQRATRGELISPRYRIAMAAYSDTVYDLLQGVESIDRLAARGTPRLSPTNSTNTYAAFEWARNLLVRELPHLHGKPAPMVCHLTDGEFTDQDPFPLATEIMSMYNDDGNVLLENIYVGPDLTRHPVHSLEQWPGVLQENELKSQYAQQLYRMSSRLPASYASVIEEEGYGLQAGCRMLIPGTSSELIELAFAMSGATPTVGPAVGGR
jgi:hypothetical protein